MKLQHLLSYVRRAVDTYQMIEEGDHIAVGISGGKDSIALLLALRHLQYFYPNTFKLEAISVSLGFKDFDLSKIAKFCETIEVPFTIYETQIAQIVFEERKESNPCSLCSKMRKGALNDVAKSHGCNKIALGHNRDDINETLLMSLFYEGRLHTMPPKMYLSKADLTMIRPLLYVPEKDIRGFVKNMELPVVTSPCPADKQTKRETTKQWIYGLEREIPKLSAHIFGAIERAKLSGWEKE